MNLHSARIPSFIISLLMICSCTVAQKSFNDYVQLYPIGESPNISFRTSIVKQETILFDANPIVRYSFSNNFRKGLLNDSPHTRAYYISFRPQLRMYTDNSFPVKMPSYRILLGTQHLFRLRPPAGKPKVEPFLGFSIESGHYSNGQDRCAFSENYEDGSKQCDSIYGLITPNTDLSKVLNRKSGNFSTNLTEIILNYQRHLLDDNNMTRKMQSVKLGIVFYHDRFLFVGNFGGYSDEDIKLYGRIRYLLGYSYSSIVKKGMRITAEENIELISGAHPSVNPFRSETNFTLFPFKNTRALGFFVCYVYGHDNYNFRFVDSGHQLAIGLTWSQFPSVTMRGGL